jgi:hypothetical protein
VQVRTANIDDRPLLLDVVRRAGGHYQCFPNYDADDLFCDTGTFMGMQPADVLVATRLGQPVGMLGCWNQASFRQTVVEGYGAPLRYLRPCYNLVARLRGAPQLPPPGSPLRCLVAALPLVVDQDPTVLAALIQAAQSRYAGSGNNVLLVGVYESDPLLHAVQRFAAFAYVTNAYLVTWQEQLPELGAAPLYLELGCL